MEVIERIEEYVNDFFKEGNDVYKTIFSNHRLVYLATYIGEHMVDIDLEETPILSQNRNFHNSYSRQNQKVSNIAYIFNLNRFLKTLRKSIKHNSLSRQSQNSPTTTYQTKRRFWKHSQKPPKPYILSILSTQSTFLTLPFLSFSRKFL